MTMPERPSSVPEEAYWDEGDNEWCLHETDDAGEKHGLVKWWRPDGTLCCATEFVHGTPHGSFKRFHENGEVSREGAFEDGKLHGTNAFVRSTGETTENFPRGLGEKVKRAEMDYVHGSVVAARAYDADGNQCMEDGEPFPETRPDGVPQDAHFRKREQDGEYRWVVGAVVDHDDGTISRTGTWRWWSPNGVLVSEEPYEDGEIHGTAKTYDEESGVLVEEAEWKAGERDGVTRTFAPDGSILEEMTYAQGDKKGPRLVRFDEDEIEEGKAHAMRGEFDGDDPVGVIEYLDGDGKVIGTVDTGLPDDLEATQSVLGTEEGFAALADRLAAERKIGASLFALVRAVGRGEAEPVKLKDALAALERPVSDDLTFHATRMCKMVVSNIQRFGGGPDKCVNSVFEGIRNGGLGFELLRFAAGVLDDTGEPEVASEVIDGAILAAPDDEAASFEYTRALVRASRGDAAGARESIARLRAHDEAFAKGIGCYISALFPEWSFWPADDSRRKSQKRLTALLDRTVAKSDPDVGRFREAIQKSATRLMGHRERLTEKFGDAEWIVPDVSHLLPDGPVEVPIPDDYGGIGINHLCRQEWTRLTWLCWLCGLDELALPEKIDKRDDQVPVHAIGFARLFMAYGEDPSERLGEMLKGSEDLAPEDRYGEIVAVIKDLAEESDWFGLLLSEAEDAPDASFLQADELAFIKTFGFWSNDDIDLFDENEEEDEDEDEDED
jgi:antitoxin component YwqK of YwqJK toxin-antitoxin module